MCSPRRFSKRSTSADRWARVAERLLEIAPAAGGPLAGALAGGVVAAICYAASQGDARGAIRNNLWMVAAERQLPEAGATQAGKGRVTVPYAVAIGAGAFAALLNRVGATFLTMARSVHRPRERISRSRHDRTARTIR